MTHHPHVHMIVPGGGLSPDGDRWIACKPKFFLPVFGCESRSNNPSLKRPICSVALPEQNCGR